MKTKIFVLMLNILAIINVYSQKENIAVLNIDVKGLNYETNQIGNIVRLELEKDGVYNVMNQYDIDQILKENGLDISNCYGSICLSKVSQFLNVDKMLTGSVEKYDSKIVVTLRLFSKNDHKFEKVNVKEYVDIPEISRMIEVSVKELLGLPNDPQTLALIEYYEKPIQSPKNLLKLNGPRMGVGYVGGLNSKILQNSLDEGGFDIYPISTQIGYQFEKAYLTSGNFMALVECIGMISGMEQGRFVPSILLLNGFRNSKNGLEIGFGPIIEVTQMARGYETAGKWNLETDWEKDPNNFTYTRDTYGNIINSVLNPNPYKITNRMDSRGSRTLSTAWVWAIGKTFRSGYLNIPVNLYFSIRKNGWIIGTSFGFNLNKNAK